MCFCCQLSFYYWQSFQTSRKERWVIFWSSFSVCLLCVFMRVAAECQFGFSSVFVSLFSLNRDFGYTEGWWSVCKQRCAHVFVLLVAAVCKQGPVYWNCIIFKVGTQLGMTFGLWSTDKVGVCVCRQDRKVMVADREQCVYKLEWPNEGVWFILHCVSP